MFAGFTKDVSNEGIAYVRSGTGHPLLLLHGFPQTHVAWHRVAPALARRFTVIAADLPGYGDSRAPDAGGRYASGSKRLLGDALLRFMRELGFARFGLAGHDRGARVAYRMALDYPEAISHLAVLDVVPTLEMAEAMSYPLATEMANWFLLAQAAPFPETLIGADPGFYIGHIVDAWQGKADAITPQAREAYTRPFRSAAVRRSVCDEYRAAAGVDLEHERADRASGRRIRCPLLALWSAGDLAGRYFDPLAVWRRWAQEVRGGPLDCGHFMMEEAPDAVAAAIESLLATASAGAARSPSGSAAALRA
jgi:haloacetate dehalogenase